MGCALWDGNEVTELRKQSQILTEVIKTQQAEIQRLRAINARLMPLHKDLFVEANPIPVKWALNAMRLIKGGIRLPLTPLSEKYHDTVRQALRAAGVIS